jgi:hypothetical protein
VVPPYLYLGSLALFALSVLLSWFTRPIRSLRALLVRSLLVCPLSPLLLASCVMLFLALQYHCYCVTLPCNVHAAVSAPIQSTNPSKPMLNRARAHLVLVVAMWWRMRLCVRLLRRTLLCFGAQLLAKGWRRTSPTDAQTGNVPAKVVALRRPTRPQRRD